MAQATINQQRQMNEEVHHQARAPSIDSGIGGEETDDPSTQGRLGVQEGRRVLIEGPAMKIHVCNVGTLDLTLKKDKPKCTKDNNCTVQLHHCQGILSNHHDSPVNQHRGEVEVALMLRITKDLGGAFRECLLCSERLEKGAEVLKHVQNHGGELGHHIVLPATLKERLDKIDMRTDKITTVCGDCDTERDTAYAMTIHRVRYHKDYYQSPTVCDVCTMPLLGATFDQHFEEAHTLRCCGEIIKTAGKHIAHLLHKHPRMLEVALTRSEIPGLVDLTNNTSPEKGLPWGTAVRVTSRKISNHSWNRRENNAPGAKSAKFREYYIVGCTQNAMHDVTLDIAGNWDTQFKLNNATANRLLIETERILIRKLAESYHEFVCRLDLTKNNPLESELEAKEYTEVCEKCIEKADHLNSQDRCVDRAQLKNSSEAFLNGQIDEKSLNKYRGVLIGLGEGWFSDGPPGQYPFLNLGFTSWDPQITTGHHNQKPVVFKESGHHVDIRPDNDFMAHVKKIVRKLPEKYSKPICLEYFTTFSMFTETYGREEHLECQVEAYFEGINKIRAKHQLLFVIVGPAITLPLINHTEEEYTAAAINLHKLNYMLSIWAVKYNFPFIPSQGFINALPHKINGQFWWTKYHLAKEEPIFNMCSETKREFLHRQGFLFDVIAESHQRTLDHIKQTIERENRLDNKKKLIKLLKDTFKKSTKRQLYTETGQDTVDEPAQPNKQRNTNPTSIFDIQHRRSRESTPIAPDSTHHELSLTLKSTDQLMGNTSVEVQPGSDVNNQTINTDGDSVETQLYSELDNQTVNITDGECNTTDDFAMKDATDGECNTTDDIAMKDATDSIIEVRKIE
jgi:hypothetical protein